MINIKIDEFEGPFNLLLKLIDKNKIDIYDIPISKLTDDYLEYIKLYVDLNEMSEFVVMASTLLEIKSKMLLPKKIDENTKEEIDPREELVKKLIEYKKYKILADKLYETDIFVDKVMFKQADEKVLKILNKKDKISVDELLDGITIDDLYNVFEDVIKRKELKTDKIRSGFKSITKSLYNIEDKILYLKDLLYLNDNFCFSKILEEGESKLEIVVTFLAMLELIKLKEIKVMQNNIFDEIIITKGEITL